MYDWQNKYDRNSKIRKLFSNKWVHITDLSNSLLYTMTYNEDLDQLRKHIQADSGTAMSIYVRMDIFPGKGLLVTGVLSAMNC